MSTPAELQAAIDGNRREGRRSSYGAYGGAGETLVQRNPSSLALHPQMSPLSLVTAVTGGQHHGPSLVNGGGVHTPLSHPHHPQHPQGTMGQPNAGEPIIIGTWFSQNIYLEIFFFSFFLIAERKISIIFLIISIYNNFSLLERKNFFFYSFNYNRNNFFIFIQLI